MSISATINAINNLKNSGQKRQINQVKITNQEIKNKIDLEKLRLLELNVKNLEQKHDQEIKNNDLITYLIEQTYKTNQTIDLLTKENGTLVNIIEKLELENNALKHQLFTKIKSKPKTKKKKRAKTHKNMVILDKKQGGGISGL